MYSAGEGSQTGFSEPLYEQQKSVYYLQP